MPEPNSTPFTTWPRHLQESWQLCVQRGEVDADNPPSSIVEAYLQVAEARARRYGGFRYDDSGQDDAPEVAEECQFLGLRPKLATCSVCGAENLEHFYRSRVKGMALCPDRTGRHGRHMTLLLEMPPRMAYLLPKIDPGVPPARTVFYSRGARLQVHYGRCAVLCDSFSGESRPL